MGSSLAFATMVALSLNLLFRLGIKKTVRLSMDHGDVDPEKVEKFLKSNGAIWGARPEVVSRATFGVIQLLDGVRHNGWERGPIAVSASFDEFNLDVRTTYAGKPLEFPVERPSNADIVSNENGVRLLAGFMLRRCADRVRAESKDGTATVFLHYDH